MRLDLGKMEQALNEARAKRRVLGYLRVDPVSREWMAKHVAHEHALEAMREANGGDSIAIRCRICCDTFGFRLVDRRRGAAS